LGTILLTAGCCRSEQAYYGVAQQFSAIALLATSSILSIFWKEIAEAHHNRDTHRVERLYGKVSRLLFFVGATMAGGLLPWAGDILHFTVGSAYAGGTATLMLMFLYPVHQSMGQIGSTMLYATGHVRMQVMLGMAFMITSLITAYFMMAPSNAPIPGLGMASQGLAWKMVALQFLHVNVVAWSISRLFRWKFDWQYQLGGLAACICLGWGTYFGTVYLLTGLASVVIQMALAGTLYLGMIATLILALPQLVGASRMEVTAYTRRLTSAIFQ
jgi:O-antigen/teichoic acid export membrane protein